MNSHYKFFNKIINFVKEKLFNFLKNSFENYNAKNRFMLGNIYLFDAQKKYKKIKDLQEVEYKIFSQTGEDGIIDFMLKKIGISNCKFVEVGVGDYSESNTRYIYEKSFSSGLIIDVECDLKKKISKNIDLWRGLINIENTEIEAENINHILKKNDFNKNIDLFSIDIDGIDYWVIDNLKAESKLFIAEYNPTFGHNLEITVPNIKNFRRFKFHYSGNYYGVSLKALVRLMEVKGYDFLGTNKLNFNAFFVHKQFSHHFDVIKKNLKNLEHYTKIKIRDSKNIKNELDFIDKKEDRLDKIRNLDIVDVSKKTKKIFKISEIINFI